jgi:hypothetical protein
MVASPSILASCPVDTTRRGAEEKFMKTWDPSSGGRILAAAVIAATALAAAHIGASASTSPANYGSSLFRVGRSTGY